MQIPELNSGLNFNTVPSGVCMKHTELSSKICLTLTFAPPLLPRMQHTQKNAEHTAAGSRVSCLKSLCVNDNPDAYVTMSPLKDKVHFSKCKFPVLSKYYPSQQERKTPYSVRLCFLPQLGCLQPGDTPSRFYPSVPLSMEMNLP